jgi:hypothetical protein
MKKSLKKIMAGVSVAAMLVSAMPVAGVFAEDAVSPFSVREVAEGVVITNYTGEAAEKIVIPARIDGKKVVGVDNFAFGLVAQEVTFLVPASLMLDYISNEAFMTKAVIDTEIVAESGADTVEGMVKYWINDFSGMNYTDEQIANAVQKAITNAGGEETLEGMSDDEKALTVIKEIQAGNCDFSQENIDRLNIMLAGIPYTLVTLQSADETDVMTYAAGKTGITYEVAFVAGDMTLDSTVNLYDAIEIAKYMMDMTEPTDEELIAGDANIDGDVNIYDAIKIAKDIMDAM